MITRTKFIFGSQIAVLFQTARSISEVLKDSHERVHTYLRISLVEKCNLRLSDLANRLKRLSRRHCRSASVYKFESIGQYCMPEEGVQLTPKPKLLTTPELMALVKIFASLGVEKVRLTGGEPLLRPDLEKIVEGIHSEGINYVGMTTNGIALSRRLSGLHKAGVTHLNISLDSIHTPKFEFITRKKGHNLVLKAIDESLKLFKRIKINCVVMRDFNHDEIVAFLHYFRNKPVDVRFIEFMPFPGNVKSNLVPYFEMLSIVREAYPNLKALPLDKNHTAKEYTAPELGDCRVGFISSMTQHFCGGCNRIRLTADGNLKTCLFGSEEASLLQVLRLPHLNDSQKDVMIRDTIRSALAKKHFQHGGHKVSELKESLNRPMILIGG